MRLIITAHARDQMHDRGITKREVLLAIERGSKFRQTDGLLAVYSYVRVAYRVVNGKYIIKTVMVWKGDEK